MKEFARKLPRYWKTVMVVIGVILALGPDLVQGLAELMGDGQWSLNDTYRLGVLVVTSYAVYKKRNVRPDGEPPSPDVSEAEIPATLDTEDDTVYP